MFNKTAIVLTQSIGAPNKAAQKDVTTCLNWMGISDVKVLGIKLMEGIIWDELSEKKRAQINRKIKTFSKSININKEKTMNLKVKLYFTLLKSMQKSSKRKGIESLDVKYWEDQGWI